MHRLTLLSNGVDDITPQMLSKKLFAESEGKRIEQMRNWISEIKKSMDLLKIKAQKFNSLQTATSKKNALSCIREFKELENERKLLLEMTKDEWHPLPEMSEKEIVFDNEEYKPKKYPSFTILIAKMSCKKPKILMK
jgi:hypothetical protein